jgi:hypothetical protein
MTVFQVEDRLFRVHRHFLAENSLVFSSMFSLPRTTVTTGSTADAEGTSDANPIHLAGVTELEFETLLRYFYKSMHDGFSLPQPSWIALLSIAHHYEFLNVRERAIREIYEPAAAQQSHDHMLLILVAEKYDVPPRHLLPSLVSFVMRSQPLTEVEVSSFSALTVSQLAHAREDFVRKTVNPLPSQLGWGIAPPNGPSWRENVAKDVVWKIWQVQNNDDSRRAPRRVMS